MLVQNSWELVERCYLQTPGLWRTEDFKDAFIAFVFGQYQEEVLENGDAETFYEHLEELKLTNCRSDFDFAVESWLEARGLEEDNSTCYDNQLFNLVKEAVAIYRPTCRQQLIQDLTHYLTSPSGFMMKWKQANDKSTHTYYQFLHKSGIRFNSDIEALIDAWLIEYPAAFEVSQQKFFLRPARRGRPNNLELSLLMEKAYEIKPELTRKEKERIRKIFYYHRGSLSISGMFEKFKKYIESKSNKKKVEQHSQPIHVG